ncbi:hypothetical protein D918_07471 [Trichuris suis]|nr:hypothetical protein D918_07471 [Trichuris suis]
MPMQFAIYLHHITANCDFDQFKTDAALLVQFVNGIRNQAVKMKLLSKGKDLTLDDALTYLQISENIFNAKTSIDAMDVKACHVVKAYPPKSQVVQPKMECRCCGKSDQAKATCPFMNAKRLSPAQRDADSFTVDVTIDGHPVIMELDIGATVRVANPILWKRIGYPKLSLPTVQLRSFSGHVILKGEMAVSVGCGDQSKQLRIRITKQSVVNIMGRDWIETFGDKESLRPILTRDQFINCIRGGSQEQGIFDRFKALFKHELGYCTKINANLQLKGVVPVFGKPSPSLPQYFSSLLFKNSMKNYSISSVRRIMKILTIYYFMLKFVGYQMHLLERFYSPFDTVLEFLGDENAALRDS